MSRTKAIFSENLRYYKYSLKSRYNSYWCGRRDFQREISFQFFEPGSLVCACKAQDTSLEGSSPYGHVSDPWTDMKTWLDNDRALFSCIYGLGRSLVCLLTRKDHWLKNYRCWKYKCHDPFILSPQGAPHGKLSGLTYPVDPDGNCSGTWPD